MSNSSTCSELPSEVATPSTVVGRVHVASWPMVRALGPCAAQVRLTRLGFDRVMFAILSCVIGTQSLI